MVLMGTSCQTSNQGDVLSKGWHFLGERGFSSKNLRALDIITINNQVYTTGTYNKKVWTWNSEKWVQLGSDFTDDYINFVKLAKDNNNQLYIAYSDAVTEAIYIKKWDGKNWVQVADTINDEKAVTMNFLINNDDIYIMYAHYENTRKMIIKKWDGTQWIDIGTGILDPSISATTGLELLIYNNELYISYNENINSSNHQKVYVKKWNGATWETIGNTYVVDLDNMDLLNTTAVTSFIEYEGKFYVGYIEKDAKSASVKVYKNGTWSKIDNLVIRPTPEEEELAVLRMKEYNGKLYILLKQQGTRYSLGQGFYFNELNMLSYDINTKELNNVGNNGLVHDRDITSSHLNFSISEDGIPYVFFSDEEMHPSGKGTVKNYQK